MPQVDWICGDIFDKTIWDGIKAKYGKIDCIHSNPPFGTISQSDTDKSWLKYTGKDIDIASIEIAMVNAEYVDMILPQGSCTFQYSGRPYYQERENRKINKLKKDTGLDFYMSSTSVDTSVYEQGFKNTSVVVECVSLEF